MVEQVSPVDITVVPSPHLPGTAPLASAAVVWRYRGALRATVVAKCSFDLMNGQPMRVRTPDDVARAALFFLSPDNGFVTRQVLYVCGGTTLGVAPV